MRWHLRYQVLADGSWTYHLGRANLRADCGATDTVWASEGDESTALRLLLGHDEGDVSWCPTCRAYLAEAIATDLEGTAA